MCVYVGRQQERPTGTDRPGDGPNGQRKADRNAGRRQGSRHAEQLCLKQPRVCPWAGGQSGDAAACLAASFSPGPALGNNHQVQTGGSQTMLSTESLKLI